MAYTLGLNETEGDCTKQKAQQFFLPQILFSQCFCLPCGPFSMETITIMNEELAKEMGKLFLRVSLLHNTQSTPGSLKCNTNFDTAFRLTIGLVAVHGGLLLKK